MASPEPLAPADPAPAGSGTRSAPTGGLRLVTIPISHYCEKGRWALDHAGLPYREERHLQGVHRVASRRAGGVGTVPVLVTPAGAIGESAEILAWTDERTPPERRLLAAAGGDQRAAEEELCRRFDERLGPAGRRLIYVRMFAGSRDVLLDYNNQGVPRWENAMMRATLPLMKRFVARALSIEPGVEVRDEDAVWEEFDHVGELLADGRSYLFGDRFGAADLTFAALSSPLVVPPSYGVALPQPGILDATTAELVGRAREHPAGRFALRVFSEHRRRPRRPAPADPAA